VLELRPIRSHDAPALHRLWSHPEVAVWLRPAGLSGPFTLAECEAIVARKVAHWTAHDFGISFAWEGETCVGLSIIQHSVVNGRSEVEIGWTVARECWGRGIATYLGQDALAVASSLGLHRVVAFTRTDNAASRRVMEKLGLCHERDFQHGGLAHVLYGASPTAASAIASTSSQ
jgi:[ribosomal protein S5]-alanine N-acetyltransferase